MTARRAMRLLPLCIGLACAPALAETIAIVDAKIYTMTAAAPVENGTIVMSDGRIVDVGANVAVPAGARRIEGRGLVVTPALFNSATQLGLTEVSSVGATNDHGVSEGPLGAAFDIQYALNPRSMLIRQAEADGLGRAVSFPTSSGAAPFAGYGVLLHLGDDAILERARFAMFAEVGGQSSARAGGSRSAQWQLIRSALDEARALRGAAKPGTPRDSAFTRLDLMALKPVVEGEVPLVIDANRESDIHQAIALARDYGIRVVVKGGSEAWRAADELAAAGVPVIIDPSINLPLYFDELGARADNAALLQRAGVLVAFRINLSIHTSFNAGFALREVAGLAVANGMDHHAALAAMTSNPAQIWGVADRGGSLAPGLDADVVLWDGDPLEPLTGIVAVFLRGREVSQSTRQAELRERYRPRTPAPALPPAYRGAE
jgi:imidazolonepropionase-like amidohydrolase